MPETENQFLRDLKLLMGIGAATALLIAGGGYLTLRGVRWEESEGVLWEIALYAGIGLVAFAVVGVWAWRVIRNLKRKPPQGDPP